MRDIVVVGGSAGGVAALKMLASQLPPDFPAAVFVVLHVGAHHSTQLPDLLSKAGPLPAFVAKDGADIVPGRIHVAPADRHLIIERGHMHLSAGPKENRTRPSLNPLFRSAALAYGPRVIGVILTGYLDDGTLGLWEIKRRGGVAIVQDPNEAESNQMPKSAIDNVPVDHILPLAEIGRMLSSLVEEPIPSLPEESRLMSSEEQTRLTCPDCHGPLQIIRHGKNVELKCRVGHSYSPQAAIAAHEEAEERVLWSAIEMLEEGADLAEQVADFHPQKEQVRASAPMKRRAAKRIRAAVEDEI